MPPAPTKPSEGDEIDPDHSHYFDGATTSHHETVEPSRKNEYNGVSRTSPPTPSAPGIENVRGYESQRVARGSLPLKSTHPRLLEEYRPLSITPSLLYSQASARKDSLPHSKYHHYCGPQCPCGSKTQGKSRVAGPDFRPDSRSITPPFFGPSRQSSPPDPAKSSWMSDGESGKRLSLKPLDKGKGVDRVVHPTHESNAGASGDCRDCSDVSDDLQSGSQLEEREVEVFLSRAGGRTLTLIGSLALTRMGARSGSFDNNFDEPPIPGFLGARSNSGRTTVSFCPRTLNFLQLMTQNVNGTDSNLEGFEIFLSSPNTSPPAVRDATLRQYGNDWTSWVPRKETPALKKEDAGGVSGVGEDTRGSASAARGCSHGVNIADPANNQAITDEMSGGIGQDAKPSVDYTSLRDHVKDNLDRGSKTLRFGTLRRGFGRLKEATSFLLDGRTEQELITSVTGRAAPPKAGIDPSVADSGQTTPEQPTQARLQPHSLAQDLTDALL